VDGEHGVYGAYDDGGVDGEGDAYDGHGDDDVHDERDEHGDGGDVCVLLPSATILPQNPH